MGISQYPFAVEAVFAVGPHQVNIDPTSLKATDGGYQTRPTVSRPIGDDVPTHTFLDPVFRAVSAIWATGIDDCWVLDKIKEIAVVHNSNATNKIPERFLPANSEYVASSCEDEAFLLATQQGRLNSPA